MKTDIRCISFLAALLSNTGFVHAETTDIEMWRLDCGQMVIDDISYFSDTFFYDGQSAIIDNGCYLIRNADQYLLWDAGLPAEVLGNTTPDQGWTSSIQRTIVDQLAQLELEATDIRFLGISHYHGDHIGQAADFSTATLLIGKADADRLRVRPPGNARRRLQRWFAGESELQELEGGDHDVFGDGSVIILSMPGHTPGHQSLLVRLPETGPVLLSGDLYHFHAEIGDRLVSQWNTSRAETLASMDRFTSIIEMINPLVIVQHDPVDTDKLPTFPNSAN